MVKKEVEKKDKPETETKEVQKFQVNEFVSETKQELAKIVWSSRQQVLTESAAVILMVTFVATVVYLVDNFFHWGAGKVFG